MDGRRRKEEEEEEEEGEEKSRGKTILEMLPSSLLPPLPRASIPSLKCMASLSGDLGRGF